MLFRISRVLVDALKKVNKINLVSVSRVLGFFGVKFTVFDWLI